MNKETKQILENQKEIMFAMTSMCDKFDFKLSAKDLGNCIDKTDDLLNPITEEEPCCEMPPRENHSPKQSGDGQDAVSENSSPVGRKFAKSKEAEVQG
jgi:hypothetical protein